MPGPPPKDPSQRIRRNATPNITRLPAEGRVGEPPAWPTGKPRVAEAAVWARIWSTPQAVAWERLGWFDAVARYCRVLVDASKPKATVTSLAEARQLEDRLGLNPLAMLRLRWEIAENEIAEARAERVEPRRLKAVDPDAVARAD